MDLTQGPIRKQLFSFSLPIILTLIFQQSYSLIDTMIVSHFCSTYAISAIASTSALYSFLIALISGFGIGCTIFAGKAYGKKDQEKLSNTLFTLLISGSLFAMFLAIICIVFSEKYLIWNHTPTKILDLSCQILQLYAGGTLFYGIGMIASNLLNGMGESKKTFYIFSTSGALNIVLDLVAVLMLDMGVIGTVLASLIAEFYSLVLVIYLLKKKMGKNHAQFKFSILKETLSVSLMSMLQNALSSGLFIFVQALVNTFGIIYINGFTAGLLINSIFTIGINGYTSGYGTMLSQNFGANQMDRIQEAKRISFKDGNCLCLSLSIIAIYLAKTLAVMMLTDVEMKSIEFAKYFIWLSIPNYFLLLHNHRISYLLKNTNHNKETLISTLMIVLVKCISIYPLVNISIYLIPFADIMSQLFALCYLNQVQRKITI